MSDPDDLHEMLAVPYEVPLMVDAKRRRADDEDEAAEREATRAAKKAASKSPASTFAFTDDRHSLLEFATELDEEHNIPLNELVSVFSGLSLIHI